MHYTDSKFNFTQAYGGYPFENPSTTTGSQAIQSNGQNSIKRTQLQDLNDKLPPNELDGLHNKSQMAQSEVQQIEQTPQPKKNEQTQVTNFFWDP